MRDTLTFAQMLDDLAGVLDLPANEIDPEGHLGDLGLDSIALMRLLLLWQETQPDLPVERLYECETLNEFWAIVEAAP
ncbi:acyl carrier protein [Thioclava sp. FTW29]|uniref:Acyl carrier protein n=1 Tax=Thioclava litoralis TaxID=3076557 RepID=A0ABZ1E2P8_9RHOB|nr:acyl carrier protein [Thioclava sp. FTW29]